MIALSRAIRQGTGTDPLVAAVAFLGHDFAAASRESACAMAIRSLHAAWPHLGETVRRWPTIAAVAEKLKIITEVRKYQPVYRREAHGSLYGFITSLHDRFKWSNEDIAITLAAARL